jgi:hypothetical protein
VIIDPKWLELFAQSGWKMAAGAIALCIFVYRFRDLPWWAYALCTLGILIGFGLAIASSVQAIHPKTSKFLARHIDQTKWVRNLRKLSDDARGLLAVVEEDAKPIFYYEPSAAAISALRDMNIIFVEVAGQNWGRYRRSFEFETAYGRHRQAFRRELKLHHQDIRKIRTMMEFASRQARSPTSHKCG